MTMLRWNQALQRAGEDLHGGFVAASLRDGGGIDVAQARGGAYQHEAVVKGAGGVRP